MGTFLLFALIIVSVVLMILAISKLKMHPFIVMILIAMFTGILGGLLFPETGLTLDAVIANINQGFGGIMTSIGIVILCGTIIGTILEKTGAALTMANAILKVVGKKNSTLAMGVMGYITGIPVFCDSGFVVLSPISRSLSKQSGTSLAVTATALSGGLYATHCLVPPTPGPIAMAGTLGADLGITILVGLIVSIPAVAVAIIWAKKVSSKININPNVEYTMEELQKKYGKLPGTLESFAPIVVPILLIAIASIVTILKGSNWLAQIFLFLGKPVVALLLGVFLSISMIPKQEKENTLKWVSDGVKDSAAILAITGAGGAFGQILKTLPIQAHIQGLAGSGLGIFVPFIIACIFKLSMGASTVAMITTSSIMVPLMETMGFASPFGRVLVVMAIGAGSMVASHANDSYFWVVAQFSDMKTEEAYKCQTGMTAAMGITIAILLFIVSLIMRAFV